MGVEREQKHEWKCTWAYQNDTYWKCEKCGQQLAKYGSREQSKPLPKFCGLRKEREK